MLRKIKKILPRKLKDNLKAVKHKLDVWRYKGSRYVCPFCEYSSSVLAPVGLDFPVLSDMQVVGAGKRLSGCYRCGATDRERLLYVYLKEVVNLFETGKDKHILHIAPEPNLSGILLDFGFEDYVCGDLHTEGYLYPEHVRDMDITHIPYPDNTFDVIICNHVLEHIQDDILAMKELKRVLKTDGFAILQVPVSKNSHQTIEDLTVTNPKERELRFGQADHVRIYGQDYAERLEKAGFKVQRLNIAAQYPEYALNADEDLFICSI